MPTYDENVIRAGNVPKKRKPRKRKKGNPESPNSKGVVVNINLSIGEKGSKPFSFGNINKGK